jgi:hypothetical protein
MFKVIKTPEQIAFEAEHAEKERRHAELLKLLRETDYVALADYDKDKPEVIAQRAEWRAEVRELDDWFEANPEPDDE